MLTVNDQANASVLRFLDRLLHAIDEIWAASTNIGSENVRSIALVMNANGQTGVRVREELVVSKDVNCQTTDGW